MVVYEMTLDRNSANRRVNIKLVFITSGESNAIYDPKVIISTWCSCVCTAYPNFDALEFSAHSLPIAPAASLCRQPFQTETH